MFKILNMLLVEESLLFRILSPQHLSQEHSKSKTMKPERGHSWRGQSRITMGKLQVQEDD
jgi:hypothetical protein